MKSVQLPFILLALCYYAAASDAGHRRQVTGPLRMHVEKSTNSFHTSPRVARMHKARHAGHGGVPALGFNAHMRGSTEYSEKRHVRRAPQQNGGGQNQPKPNTNTNGGATTSTPSSSSKTWTQTWSSSTTNTWVAPTTTTTWASPTTKTWAAQTTWTPTTTWSPTTTWAATTTWTPTTYAQNTYTAQAAAGTSAGADDSCDDSDDGDDDDDDQDCSDDDSTGSTATYQGNAANTYSPTYTSTQATSTASSSGQGTGQVYTGSATFYYQNGIAGACGTVAQDSTPVVALYTSIYANGANCGRTVKITNTDTGASVTATVRDECPTCSDAGHIDLSTGAFDQIGSESTGMLNTQWQFMD